MLIGNLALTVVPGGSATGAHFGIGMATSSTNQVTLAAGADDASATMDTGSYNTDNQMHSAIGNAGGTTIQSRIDFSSFDSGGFTTVVDTSGFSATIQAVWVALSCTNVIVGNSLTRTDGNDIAISGLGWKPAAGFVISHCGAETTTTTLKRTDKTSIGAFTSATERVAHGVRDEDNVGDSNIATAVEHDEVYVRIADTNDTVEGLMDVKSVDTGGVTFVMDDTDPDAAFFGYALFGPAEAGGVSVTPTAATCIASTTAPTVVLGSQTITPVVSSAIARTTAPTAVLGSQTVTPVVSSAIASITDPAVELGSIVVTPVVSNAIASVTDPDVEFGSVLVTPAVASAIAKTIDPTVVITGGSETVTPTAATCIASTTAPTVVLGSQTITPVVASAIVSIANPTTTLGSIATTPGAASAIVSVSNPDVELGSIIVTPVAASAIASVIAPDVLGGGVTVTPVIAASIVSVSNPLVVLGSLAVTPDPATVIARVVAPTVIGPPSEGGGGLVRHKRHRVYIIDDRGIVVVEDRRAKER
jgi:hypothetical protein